MASGTYPDLLRLRERGLGFEKAQVENCYIESFNGRLRDECLNVEVFFALIDVRDKLERWRRDYNQVRPHSALRDSAPAVFAAQWIATAAPGPEAVSVRPGKPAEGTSLEILT